MKPEHFIYKSDGLYYMQNVPEKPDFKKLKLDKLYGDYKFFSGYKDSDVLNQYNEALERAKSEAVKVESLDDREAIGYLILLKYNETKEGEIYTINMEEKIEVVEVPADSGFPHIDSTSYPTFRKIARIEAPKNEPDHECTMDLMTDVCVYSCECGKIEVASNLSYHDKPKTYIPESAPKKEEESEDEFLAYIEWLKNQSFEGWNKHAVSGYNTALLSLYRKYVEIKRKPL